MSAKKKSAARAGRTRRAAGSGGAGRAVRARAAVKRGGTTRARTKRAGARASASRRAPRPAGRDAKLALVARRAAAKRGRQAPATAAPAPPAASFPQTRGASVKQLAVFRLLKSRAQVLAAIQGLVAGAAEQPLGEGKWNVREIVLHLCCRDRARLREFESALRGTRVSWQGLEGEAMARLNAEEVGSISRLSWDEALRMLHSTRQSLMEAIEGVPDEPADVWSPDHPFGWMIDALPRHDQHHADIIKQWRAETGA